jgi:hypothetical protein
VRRGGGGDLVGGGGVCIKALAGRGARERRFFR